MEKWTEMEYQRRYLEERHNRLAGEIEKQVVELMDYMEDIEDQQVLEWIDEVIQRKGSQEYIELGEKIQLRKEVFNALRKLDVLQELVDDGEITEIMINGDKNIFIEKEGSLYRWEKSFLTREKLEDVIQQIVGKTNRMVNETHPIVDTRLENGSRVNIVLPPIALNGPIVTIRRFPDKPITMDKLVSWKSIDNNIAKFLKQLVRAKYNIFISGGTGSGKTTFLNVLSEYIPKEERIITIEDSAELQIQSVENLVRLETRNANSEGKYEVSIRELIKTALRMRPDRIILGEVRGAEAVDLLQCMNTGHDGSLSTGHGNSCKDMLRRLEMMVLMGLHIPLEAVQRQIASGIDIIVHLGRLQDKTRKVLEITEVLGYEDGEIQLNPLFRYRKEGRSNTGKIEGMWENCGVLIRTDKLRQYLEE